MDLQGVLNDLSVNRMFYVIFDSNDDGFVHLIADYATDSNFSEVSFFSHCFILLSDILLTKNRHNTGDVVLDVRNFVGIVELIDRVLETEIEKFAFQLLELVIELFGTHAS
jgi:hypothetical protein